MAEVYEQQENYIKTSMLSAYMDWYNGDIQK